VRGPLLRGHVSGPAFRAALDKTSDNMNDKDRLHDMVVQNDNWVSSCSWKYNPSIKSQSMAEPRNRKPGSTPTSKINPFGEEKDTRVV